MVKRIENIINKIIIIMIIFHFIFMPISNAASTLEQIINQGDEFLAFGKDKGGDTLINSNRLKGEVSTLYNIILTLGVCISVVVGAVLGIKFITGSIEEQAKIKEALVPYVLGCVVVFSAFGIWKLVVDIGQNIVAAEQIEEEVVETEEDEIENEVEKTKFDIYVYHELYWCDNCNRELQGGDLKAHQRHQMGDARCVPYLRQLYKCSNCHDSIDEFEMARKWCEQCRANK